MSYESTIAIRNNVALTDSAWTDIGGSAVGAYAIPISCNQIIVINTGSVAISLATDPGNANSIVPIPPGASWALGVGSWGPRLGGPSSGARFRPNFAYYSNDAVCSLQSSSGSFDVTAEFVL